MIYSTKTEAMQHLDVYKDCAAKQTQMIDAMYEMGMTVSQDDLDNISLDYSRARVNKAMSY